MHLLVFEDRPERARLIQHRIAGALEIGGRNRLLDQAVGRLDVLLHFGPRRPRRVSARDRSRLALGIDAAREDRFEVFVDAPPSERLLDQGVHGERRDVPLVENNRIAQRDRALVIDRFVEQVEQRAGPAPVHGKSREDVGPIENGGWWPKLRHRRSPESSELTLTCSNTGQYADIRKDFHVFDAFQSSLVTVTITLNGERFELDSPMSVAALLAQLDIDPRRVAVEHNLNIIKRQTYPDILIGEGDTRGDRQLRWRRIDLGSRQ